MSKIINITDKLSNEKPVIVIGEKKYTVDDSMRTLMKFEELTSRATIDNMKKAIDLAFGEGAAAELNVESMSANNFKVLSIAIMASMMGTEYEEAEKRFQKSI